MCIDSILVITVSSNQIPRLQPHSLITGIVTFFPSTRVNVTLSPRNGRQYDLLGGTEITHFPVYLLHV